MRNAPTNSATAAISAVVARKSAVETRSDAARSRGDDSTYGSAVSATSSADADLGRGRALADDDVDAADAVDESSRCAVRSGTTTVRPPEPTNGPSPARIPTTVSATGPSAPPWNVTFEPTASPSSAASRSVTRAPNASGPARRSPAASGRSRTCASAAGSMPSIVTGCSRSSGSSIRRGRGTSVARGPGPRRRPPAPRRSRPTLSGERPVLAERGDPQVRPADEVVDGPVDRGLDPGVGRERREQDADAQRDPDDRQQRPAAAGARGCGARADVRPPHRSEARARRGG